MRKSSLRKTTLLSLLGISSAQSPSSSSWGEPFAVDPAGTTSTDNLLDSASPTPTWGSAFSVDNSAVITPTSSLPTSDAAAPSLAVDTSSPVPLNPDVTVISGIQSVVGSRSASFDTSATTQSVRGTGSTESTQSATSSGSTAAEATGAATPAREYKKMGFVGAIAGAAGVMFV